MENSHMLLTASDPEAEKRAKASQRVKAMVEEQYWAALPKRSEQYATKVLEIFDSHLQLVCHSAFGHTMWQAYRAYHLMDAQDDWGGDSPITEVMVSGEQGELLSMDLPHFRQLILHKKNLVAGDRLAFDPQAATNDGDALNQVGTAKQVLNYVFDQLGLGKGLRDSEEISLVTGCSYLHLGWDPYRGDTIGVSTLTGRPTYTGNLRWNVLGPWEVAHQMVREYKDARWHVVRGFESKYDLAMRLLDQGDPRSAEQLLEYNHTSNDYQFVLPDSGYGPDTELVPVYHVYHDRTPAIPNGRMSTITADGLFLFDGDLPYPFAPIVRNCPNELLGSALPFANSWGWIALQEQLNAVMSSMITRTDQLAHPMISVPADSDWSHMGPYQIHERAAGEENPYLVDLAVMPPALPGLYQLELGELQRLSGINSVVQGQPNENVSSGSYAALIHAQALTFANDDVEQFVTTAEKSASITLQVFQARASEEMLIRVAGESNQGSYKAFKGEAIRLIKSVSVRRGNPLMRTTSAKQEAATALLSQGLISAQEFFVVMETGTMPQRSETSQLAVIQKENAMILDGVVPKVGEYEPFHLHIQHHAGLEDEYVKNNPAAFAALQKHIRDTFAKWQEISIANPARLQALNIPVLPPTPKMQAEARKHGLPVGDGATSGQNGQQAKGKPGPKPQPQTRGVDNKAKMPKGPRMPEPARPPSEG